MVATKDPQSREPWVISFTLRCFSLPSCINEYVAIDSGYRTNSLDAVIAAWLYMSLNSGFRGCRQYSNVLHIRLIRILN